MARARVLGEGAVAEAASVALGALGWELAGPDRGVELLVVVATGPGMVPTIPPEVEAMAADLPAPARDATGEWRAPGQVVVLIDRAAALPGTAAPAETAATAATLAWLRDAALRLAPGMRVNGLALDPAWPGDLRPVLGWLTRADAVTGLVLGLGAAPRPDVPWRSRDTLRQSDPCP